MPFALNLFHDQIGADGSSSKPLPAAHRMIFVRHGCAAVNGKTLNADEAIYSDEPVTMQASTDWTQVWRWEISSPNAAPALFEGTNILSKLRMSRVITHMPLLRGSRWLFRLDQITSAAGRMADRHQHPGPGIRCLLEGTFNVQSVESARDLMPGDAWYETGPGYCDRLGFAADGVKVPARDDSAARMGGQSYRNVAVRRTVSIAPRHLEGLRR